MVVADGLTAADGGAEIGQLDAQADSGEVQTDSNEVQTDAIEVQTDSNEVQTDSNEVQTDSIEVQTDASEVQTDAPTGCTTDADCLNEEDGNLCNGTLYCDKTSGKCLINPATVVNCDPGADTACKKAACLPKTGLCALVPVKDGALCDDKNKCTEGDVCIAGSCDPGENTCLCKATADCAKNEDGNLCNGTLFCNKATGGCQLNPATVVSCPSVDDTACSKNTCQPKTGQCAVTAIDGALCDDGNPCTPNEQCTGGKCAASANTCVCQKDADCAAKDDGNLCNGTLYCDTKQFPYVCALNPASVVSCPSVNDSGCLKNLCQPATGQCKAVPLPNGATCDADSTDCTAGDTCSNGACNPGSSVCQCQTDGDCAGYENGDPCDGTLYCNKVSNTCLVNPATVVFCPFGQDTACARNACDKQTGACAMKPINETLSCDADGSPCTPYDSCANGKCVAGSNVCECTKDTDCTALDDTNLCNGQLVCDTTAKKCVVNPATVVTCPKGIVSSCTQNQCDPATGKCSVQPAYDYKWCDGDANPCTLNDTCVAGNCELGKNICACNLDSHCDGKDNGSLCDGVLFCNKVAVPFVCDVAPSTTIACPTGQDTACLHSKCQPKTGKCLPTASALGTACDDGSPCTSGDNCQLGNCLGAAKNCDDGDPCTADSCLTKSGLCTHKPETCDDANSCTADQCDAKLGCKNTAVAGEPGCDDSNLCTGPDSCASGACKGAAVSCDDGKACTLDTCSAASGCKNTPMADGAPCSDGNLCTLTDVCKGNACAGTPADCDDSNVCTTDTCTAKTGQCANTPSATLCDDGNVCTDDSCDPVKGCTATNSTKPCTTANLCLLGTTCKTGQCQGGTATDCDDKIACTADSCDPVKGCLHAGNKALCDDGDPCTDQACDAAKGCSNPPLPDQTPCATERFCAKGLCVWATQVDVGNETACALRADGTVWCWGKGDTGQLGTGKSGIANGKPVMGLVPTQVLNVSGAVQLAVGPRAACALLGSGQVLCWGDQGYQNAMLGTGEPGGFIDTPKPMKNMTDATQVWVGYGNSCVRRASGEIWCAGINSFGDFGLGGAVPVYSASLIKTAWSGAAALGLGNSFACGVIGGKTQCAGWNAYGQIGVGTNTVSQYYSPTTVNIANAQGVAVGDGHTCALLGDGKVQCWGRCPYDQLGTDKTCGTNGMNATADFAASLDNVVQVDAGHSTSCALKADGSVWCWGRNDSAQVGDGGAWDQPVPRLVVGLPACVSVAAGNDASCALDKLGQVWCWGKGEFGALGDGGEGVEHVQGYPAVVPASAAVGPTLCKGQNCDDGNPCSKDTCDGSGACTHSNVSDGTACQSGNFCHQGVCKWAIDIAAGADHTCALRGDGSVQCWGKNVNGQLGSGSMGGVSAAPQPVSGASSGVALAAKANTTCVVQKSGAVQCWGAGDHCQLGGKVGDQGSATTVAGVANMAQIAVGTRHVCGIASGNGDVLCWGDNTSGQLGDNAATATPVCTPKLAAGAKPDLKPGRMALGDSFSIAMAEIGYGYYWGKNDKKQLTSTLGLAAYGAPQTVSAVGQSDLTAGDAFACAIVTADKSVRCWGDNAKGQATATPGATPIGGPTTVATGPALTVRAGSQHACAVTTGKTVNCWGKGDFGQLGQGSGGTNGVAAVVGLGSVDKIAAGGDHTCALDAAGQVWCWGRGDAGQLGNGQSGPGVQSAVPIKVVASAAAAPGALCAGLGYCDDGDPCTTDVCTASTGKCDHPPADDGMACGTQASGKLCVAGACKTPWAVELALGYGFTCARKVTGALSCFGGNGQGTIGAGVTTGVSYPTPVAVTGFASGAVAMAASDYQACAVRGDGKVLCWGSNSGLALGNGASLGFVQTTPSEVTGLTDKIGVAMGMDTGCAWNAKGDLHCWGLNDNGQAGTGTVSTVSPYSVAPSLVTGVSGVVQVSIGAVHSCARTADSKLWCWGLDSGALGTLAPSGKAQPVPTQIAAAGPIAAVAASAYNTTVLDASGYAHAWTRDSQYGNPGYYKSSQYAVGSAPPLPVLGKLSQIASGNYHTCGKLADGRVACWGTNTSGEATAYAKVSIAPRPSLIHGVIAAKVWVGRDHSCALRKDGSLACWGSNYYGQYGNGAVSSSTLKGVSNVSGTGPQ